jgi:hypothetical protein
LPLKRLIDRQVRQVRAVAEVAQRSRNTHQSARGPRGHNQVGPAQHLANCVGPINGPPLGQRRADEHVDELLRR